MISRTWSYFLWLLWLQTTLNFAQKNLYRTYYPALGECHAPYPERRDKISLNKIKKNCRLRYPLNKLDMNRCWTWCKIIMKVYDVAGVLTIRGKSIDRETIESIKFIPVSEGIRLGSHQAAVYSVRYQLGRCSNGQSKGWSRERRGIAKSRGEKRKGTGRGNWSRWAGLW